MKKILLLTIFIGFSTTLLQAQSRVLTGHIIDEELDFPLPGVTLKVKNTQRGTITNSDGYYELLVELGEIVQIRYVGYDTREFVITRDNSVPYHLHLFKINPSIYPPQLKESLKYQLSDFLQDTTKQITQNQDIISVQKKGKTYLWEAKQKNNKDKQDIYIRQVNSFDYVNKIYWEVKDNDSTLVIIPSTNFENRWVKSKDIKDSWHVNFVTSFEVGRAIGLPQLQNQYAQGRPQDGNLIWRGAHQNEVFSWGPPVSNLFYTQTPYPYDKRGMLGSQHSDMPAQTFDAHALFQTAHQRATYFSIVRNLSNHHKIKLHYRRSEGSDILPNQFNVSDVMGIQADINVYEGRLMLYPMLNYQKQTNHLPMHGANLASVLQSAWLSPTTFDDANGLNRRNALQNSAAYWLNDNKARSFAPDYFDNPYAILSQLPDKNTDEVWNSATHYQYHINKYLNVKGGISHNENIQNHVFGQFPNSALRREGLLTQRFEKNTQTALVNTIRGANANRFKTLQNISLTHQYHHYGRTLQREDGIGFEQNYDNTQAADLQKLNSHTMRETHEILLHSQLNIKNILKVNLGNASYSSSTLDKNYWLQPTITSDFNVTRLAHQLFSKKKYYSYTNNLLLYGSYTRSIQETSLSYPSWHFNSTQLAIAEAASFTENQEMIFQKGLLPSQHRKANIGMDIAINYDKLHFALYYSNERITDFVLPQFDSQSERFEFANIGTVVRRELTAVADFNHWIDYSIFMRYNAKITFPRPFVETLYQNEIVPIAGFSSVQTALVENQPYGVIVGTAYLRNEQGQLIIDDEGYPLADEQLRIIGNTVPNFVLNFNHSMTVGYKHSFVIDVNWQWQQGGDIWNGTQQQLDYYGRSQNSADLRNTRNYIFEGVRQDGTPNTTAVNFANETLPVEQNRWLRYGERGVAEDYIQSGSFFRLRELSLSYKINYRRYNKPLIPEAKISVFVQNLFVLTPYNGSLPQTHLFGYTEGIGLDFFNMPNMRQWGITISVDM
ncbi:MAG: carboxypeptidase-like regulatory domain-containing protein [Bernardetiaceae bacterium]|nr:carboxypeptidase-like regulatory domain-containing protein [Bernardetiaceae bacterium]